MPKKQKYSPGIKSRHGYTNHGNQKLTFKHFRAYSPALELTVYQSSPPERDRAPVALTKAARLQIAPGTPSDFDKSKKHQTETCTEAPPTCIGGYRDGHQICDKRKIHVQFSKKNIQKN